MAYPLIVSSLVTVYRGLRASPALSAGRHQVLAVIFSIPGVECISRTLVSSDFLDPRYRVIFSIPGIE